MYIIFWFLFLLVYLAIFLYFFKKIPSDEKLFLYVSGLVLIFAAPFIHFTITETSSIGFITSEHYDAWISFYGSIIGGILTVLGVWWTFMDQDKKRKEENAKRDKERRDELAAQYRPIINLTEKNLFFPLSATIELDLILSNKGRGECSNLTVSVTEGNCIAILHELPTDQVCANDSMGITFYICNDKNETGSSTLKPLIPIKENDEFQFKIKLDYNDIFQNNYVKEYCITIKQAKVMNFSPVPTTNIEDIFTQYESAKTIWKCYLKEI